MFVLSLPLNLTWKSNLHLLGIFCLKEVNLICITMLPVLKHLRIKTLLPTEGSFHTLPPVYTDGMLTSGDGHVASWGLLKLECLMLGWRLGAVEAYPKYVMSMQI